MLATSGAAAIILAFATQNLLGGVIAGMSLQISKPYKVGDWLQVADRYAEVMEINWRSTRLRTNDAIYLDIPNNEIVRQTIINLHYPQQLHAMRIVVGVDYNTPPNKVKDALMQATLQAEGVQKSPEPKIYLKDFGDFAISYEIKFWMLNHQDYNNVCDAIRTNIWYKFKRQKITIPFPIRTLEVTRKRVDPAARGAQPDQSDPGRRAALQLPDGRADRPSHPRLAHRPFRARRKDHRAGGGGNFHVCPAPRRGRRLRLAERQHDPGRLATDGRLFWRNVAPHRRTAHRHRAGGRGLRSDRDSKPAMAAVLREAPECVTQLSELLATRKMETEGLLKDLVQGVTEENKAREYRATFLRRLRSVFEL